MIKKRKFPVSSNETDTKSADGVVVKKPRPNNMSECQRVLFECSDYWEAKFKCEKRKNKGGSVVIQQPFFPPSLANPLWSLLAPNVNLYEKVELIGEQIERFNVLFGACEYRKSGWCFESYPKRQEKWNVQRIVVTYSSNSGLLKLTFDTEKSNWKDESFTFRESITSKKKET